ncbi:replication-relaxation family protein [Pseudofrankia sp. BMG5.37]|uniref:replication-relaxation family protein n=1 Tax=Pseudofrankia sp. BMG5.37 TaxID=3050035 RepID=UPI002894D5AF|nr:replication-relaxation family protein [Pseudofrankia sp. BMG5.37]MDT3438281.1 replication-relaxation family protein [Pseudofrankia sp. BMG5.37]
MAALAATITPREREILSTVASVRVATGAQLVRLHLGDVSARRARGVLASMVAQRLLGRLPRRIGGVRAGSAGFVYTLDVAGLRILDPERQRWQRPWPVGTPFLAHSLAVTELYISLREAEAAGLMVVAGFQAEPASWRGFPGVGGGRMVLKPDARVRLRLGRYEDTWMVEVDRATESLPTIRRKCETYIRYWQSGREGEVFPRVLWLVPDQRRYDQLVDLLARLPEDAWPLFTVALFGDAVPRLIQGAAE